MFNQYGSIMFKNYFKTALRNLLRNKTFSFIHISGLTIGITCLIFIYKYVSYELSFDKSPEHYDKICRVTGSDYAQTPVPLGDALRDYFPEITQTLRINKVPKKLISSGSRNFYEEGIILADPSILSMFSYGLIAGNRNTALSDPFSIVITKEAAQKYFGSENPLGKRLTLDQTHVFQVTGVLKDVPKNSHLHFDFLCPLVSAKAVYNNPRFFDSPINTFVYTYIRTNDSADLKRLNARMGAFEKYYQKKIFIPLDFGFSLQPLASIHLHSSLGGELEPNGSITYVYVFSSAAILILLIACINYVNLSTARYLTRIKEVGIRKVAGAARLQLIAQFTGEAVFLSFIALALSLILYKGFTPLISSFLGSEEIFQSAPAGFLFYSCLIALSAGILSGIFPALFISKFQPAEILSKKLLIQRTRLSLRSMLVILQFSISAALIFLTIVINRQLSFLQNKNLGFTKEQVVILPVLDGILKQQSDALKNELMKDPSVISASFSSIIPGGVKWVTSFHWEGRQKQDDNTMCFIAADCDFLKTYNIQLAEGRGFSNAVSTDEKEAYIINQAALGKLGWKSPLGKRIQASVKAEGRIIGMVKDFHFKSLHSKIEPLCIYIDPGAKDYLSIRIKTGSIVFVLGRIEEIWKKFSPGKPYEYIFFDDYLSKLYRKEQNTGKLFDCFSFIAIFIACLGIFGLAAFTSESRKKEIGIRKALGASPLSIVRMLLKEFLVLITAALILGCAVSWYLSGKWLSNFAYHADLSIWVFIAVAALVTILVLTAILAVVLRAAYANCAENLRYE